MSWLSLQEEAVQLCQAPPQGLPRSIPKHPVVAGVIQVDDSSDDRHCVKLNCVGGASWLRHRQLAYSGSPWLWP
jgi:hypothetical protein